MISKRIFAGHHVAALLFLFGLAAPLPAQQDGEPHGGSRVPVTVALVEEIPYPDAPYVVIRSANPDRPDVLLLPVDVDERRFTEAVQMLLTARRQFGDQAGRDVVLRGRVSDSQERGRRALPWAERVIRDLHAAPPREVAGVGTVPAVQIWLPRQGQGVSSPGT